MSKLDTPKNTPSLKPDNDPSIQETVSKAVMPTVFKDRTPMHWTLRLEGETVIAANVRTGETFEGSMVEFNQRMKG